MLRSALLTIVLSTISLLGLAQSPVIKGIVKDKTDQNPLNGATVSLLLQADSSLVSRLITDQTGTFQFSPTAPDSFIVTVDMLNYQQYVSFFTIREAAEVKEMGSLQVDRQGKDLASVTVVAKAAAVTQKGDTAQFSASQYKVNPDATTEDLIKKMPGITVAKDGSVTAQGEQVRKVTIDGKDFFGDDASAALKNLPSEVVDKIQVFDRLSDQAQQTGVDDGNTVKAINIVTKSGIKNGQFGRIYGGYGTDDRYAAGGNASFFKGDRRISIVGNFNNVNQQNFGSQDLLGLTSSGNNRGGGGGGRGGMGGFGGGNNFSVGQAAGISKTNALGINFSNKYGEKFNLTGSYFYNQSNNTNNTIEKEETFASPNNQVRNSTVNNYTTNYNHRINLRMEYKLDSNNSFFFIPSVNLQGNNSNSLSTNNIYFADDNAVNLDDSVSNSSALSESDRKGYNIRNNIMWRHNFAKKGRVFSLGLNTNMSRNTGESITDAAYRFYDTSAIGYTDSLQNRFTDNLTSTNSYGANIAYVEPVGKKGQLQFEYNPNIQKSKADQQTFNYDGSKYSEFDERLSNKFDNVITTHRAGITYRYNESRDAQFSVGLNAQATTLESERLLPTQSSLKQSFSDLLPNAMYRKKFDAKNSVRLFYRANVNFPSVNQLQDVYNLSNPLRVSVGNPALEQSNTHFLGGGYTYTNTKKSTSLFLNFFAQTASDYITNATYIASADSVLDNGIELKKGSQLTKPVNVDGYRSLRGFLTYSMPAKFIKSTLNLSAGVNYSKLPGMVNNIELNTDNVGYNAGIVLASNISEYVDFNINYNANFNRATNSTLNRVSGNIEESLNKYVNQSAGIAMNLLSKNGWFIQNDVTNQSYSGLGDEFDQSYWLWNAAIGKKFLKNKAGELKLSVFDLLKQNQAITRTVTSDGILDSQSQVLQQYFMLTFTYSLKNFGTPKKAAGNSEEGQRRQGPGMGGPAGPGGPGF
jgi:hypothetical protein